MSKIKNPAKFLSENGLLFEINRKVLHPLGLSLEVSINYETNTLEFTSLQDSRNDPEGIVYSNEQFERGKINYNKYLKEIGNKSLKTRKLCLGFIEQDIAEALNPKLEFCFERINYFKTYEDDWDGEGSLAPTSESATLAQNFAKWAVENNILIHNISVSRCGAFEFSIAVNKNDMLVAITNSMNNHTYEILTSAILNNEKSSVYDLCKEYLDE